MGEFWALLGYVVLTGFNADEQAGTEVKGRELLPLPRSHAQVIPPLRERLGRELLSTALDVTREIIGRHRERPGSRLRTAGYLRDGAR